MSFKSLRGGGLFFPIIDVTKTKIYLLPQVSLKKYQKFESIFFNIDTLIIFHITHSEDMQLYWGLCKVSYCEVIVCLIFSQKGNKFNGSYNNSVFNTHSPLLLVLVQKQKGPSPFPFYPYFVAKSNK